MESHEMRFPGCAELRLFAAQPATSSRDHHPLTGAHLDLSGVSIGVSALRPGLHAGPVGTVSGPCLAQDGRHTLEYRVAVRVPVSISAAKLGVFHGPERTRDQVRP
jgi:hypothetical protein